MQKMVVLLLVFASFAFAGTYVLSYSQSQFSFGIEEGYDRVQGEQMAPRGVAGSPELPVQSLVFIIPNGMKVRNVDIVSMSTEAYNGMYDIYPKQPEYQLDEEPPPWVPQDSVIYNRDELFPNNPITIVEHGRIDGIPVVSITVCPLQYNPVRDSLYLIRDITIAFDYEPDHYGNRPLVRSQRMQEIYDDHLTNCGVYNSWEVPVCYAPPSTVIPYSSYSQYPVDIYDMVIITPPVMVEAMQYLAKWLWEKGMPTRIVTTDWIYQNYDGVWDSTCYAGFGTVLPQHAGTDYAKIKEFLYDSWYSKGTCYALLVGIIETGMPAWYNDVVDHPSDLWYQSFDGSWPNKYEEIWVGRIPAWNAVQAEAWVYKRLMYERSPSNANKFHESLWITQDNEPDGWQFDSLMDLTIRETDFDKYMRQHKVVGHPCNPNNHGLIDTLNIGYGLVNQYGHGAGDTWKTKYYTGSPKELLVSWDWDNYPSYEEFTNVDKYYVVWALGCETSYYDTMLGPPNCTGWNALSPLPCCGEGFVCWYDTLGAVAYDGDVRGGSDWDRKAHANFIVLYTRGGSTYSGPRIGNIHAKQFYTPLHDVSNAVAYMRHLFGSPEMEVWQSIPLTMRHEHNVTTIPVNATSDVVVTVYDTYHKPESPMQNATVVLYKGIPPTYEIYRLARTNTNGEVRFTITPKSTGRIMVTTTAKGCMPYETCIVVSGKGLEPKSLIEQGEQARGTVQDDVFGLLCQTVTGSLKVRCIVPDEQLITLDVYDVCGTKVSTMEKVVSGVCDYEKEGLSSGAYFVVLHGEKTIVKKVLIVK